MSLYFLFNNIHFALELMGAVAFLMAAWLTFDTYTLRKDGSVLMRSIGFGFFAVWQVVYAVTAGNDILSYIGSVILLIALALIAGSFLKHQELHVQAVIVLPAFSLWSGVIQTAAAMFFFITAYLSYRRSVQEMNVTWRPFYLSFACLGLAAVLSVFVKENQIGIIATGQYLFQFVGFALLAWWVWQYLQLRIRESLILIFISAALFLSTVVTLAFSTILISQITEQTQSNLLTDARVLDLAIKSLQEESLAKVEIISLDTGIQEAIQENDFVRLDEVAESFMEEYRLGFLTIADKDGSVLVRAHALSRKGDSLIGERAFEEAIQGKTFVTIENSIVEKLSIRAGAPLVRDGQPMGVVIAGYQLDNALVDRMKRVTGLEMLIYNKNTSVAATALAADGRTRVTGVPVSNSEVEQTVLVDGKSMTAESRFYGAPYQSSFLPLVNGDKKIVGMISAAKPEQDILDIANATNRLTLITIIIIMLALAYPIYFLTRRLTSEGA
ncbi:MAG: cache domain-containing protein [Patescibacteria group bacterium]